MDTGVGGQEFTAPGSPSRFPSPTWLPEAPDTHQWDRSRQICPQSHGIGTVPVTCRCAGPPSQTEAHSKHVGCGEGLKQMCGNLVEGLCKEQLCQEQSLQCQIPSNWGWHCLVHLPLFWMESATSISSSTQSVCKARNRINKIAVKEMRSRLRLLSDIFL